MAGIPKSSLPTSSTPYEEDFLIHAKEVIMTRNESKPKLESETTTNPNDTVAKLDKVETKPKLDLSETKTKPETKILDKSDSSDAKTETLSDEQNDSNEKNDEVSAQTTYNSATDQLTGDEQDDCPYLDENVEVQSTESYMDLGKGDDSIYIVTIKGEEDPLFVIVTDKYIVERDAIVNAKEKSKWDLERLTSCELMDGDPPYIQLEFDTLRSDRKMRQYLLDDPDEMRRLIGVLRTYLESKPPEKLLFYKCMKCSKTFGIEKKHSKQQIQCPACFSDYVFEETE